MINTGKFMDAAIKSGIAPFELTRTASTTLSIRIFMDEMEEYNLANNSNIRGRGIVNGKLGSFSSDKANNSVISLMCESIVENAKYGNDYDADLFIKPGRIYKRPKYFNPALSRVDPKEFISLGKRISKKIREKEKRITISEVQLEYVEDSSRIDNSNGLKLKDHRNYLFIYVSTKLDYKGEIQSGSKMMIADDMSKVNEDKIVEDVIAKTIAQIGSCPVKSGKYTVLFDSIPASYLLRTLLSHMSQYEVNKKLSKLENQLGKQAFSKKLTITENPFAKNPFGSVYDSEGVPTTKKVLVERGVLNVFYSDLESAKEAGKESTGNGKFSRGSIKSATGYCCVKRGKKSFVEALNYIKDGIFITGIEGTATGLIPQTGNYSLQAEGFIIKDGKLDKPVSLITVAGNVFEDFKRIAILSNETELTMSGISTPPIAIRKVSISGI